MERATVSPIAHHQIDDACYDERHLVNVLFHTAIQSVKVSLLIIRCKGNKN